MGGRYAFLNIERRLLPPVDWRLECWPEAPHLWRFVLHFQEALLDLTACAVHDDNSTCSDYAWQLVQQWIDGNKLTDPRVLCDAWHPYCISRRLPVWIQLCITPHRQFPERDYILNSIYWQARYLEAHLEWDVRGNHLLENVRALAYAGAFLSGRDADRWLRQTAQIFRGEILQQVLPHGEHFERSPMYHARAIEVLVDIRDVLAIFAPELAQAGRETTGQMAYFLRQILHPDSGIPLLGDSCCEPTLAIESLLARAQSDIHHCGPIAGSAQRMMPGGMSPAKGGRAAVSCNRATTRCSAVDADETTGLENNSQQGDRPSYATDKAATARIVGDYWSYRSGGEYLLLDAGPVGADHLPAHAHADLLGFEASVQGQRVFVDSGVYGCEDDPMRGYCRSSAAHNVLQIDGKDQCDMWSRFRMGYRGHPGPLTAGADQCFYWATSTHDAYRRLGVSVVGRWIACRPGGPWLCVDWAQGRSVHEYCSRLHLHPLVRVQKIADREVRMERDDFRLRLTFLTPGRLEIAKGWYCPEFGRRLASPVVEWRACGPLPVACGWCLTWEGTEGVASLTQEPNARFRLQWAQQGQPVFVRMF
jgi:uncharacterized heparinase superfamily protein